MENLLIILIPLTIIVAAIYLLGSEIVKENKLKFKSAENNRG